MSEIDYENKLRSIANKIEYPRTPDIAGFVTTRLRTSTRRRFNSKRLAWSLTIILVLLSSLLLIPSARAAIIEFIQIGVVRIFRAEPTQVPVFHTEEAPATMIPMTAASASTIPNELANLAGEITLSKAQKKVDFPILLPAYPDDLGLPQHVYLQDMSGSMLILVWIDPVHPERVRLALHAIESGSWAIEKTDVKVIQETSVNGQPAAWVVGPYIVRVRNGDIAMQKLIEGHVLIWKQGEITYRLENDLPLEEAIKIAESLHPMEP